MGHLYDGYVKSPEGTMFSTIDDDHLRSNGSGATRSAAQADHANIASLTVEDGLPTTDHWAPPELRVGNIASLHRFESFWYLISMFFFNTCFMHITITCIKIHYPHVVCRNSGIRFLLWKISCTSLDGSNKIMGQTTYQLFSFTNPVWNIHNYHSLLRKS